MVAADRLVRKGLLRPQLDRDDVGGLVRNRLLKFLFAKKKRVGVLVLVKLDLCVVMYVAGKGKEGKGRKGVLGFRRRTC